tara:strand:+ start:37364 stop:37831 length:468 start_codon:yes stop_codon:yes gene_type:complete
MKKILSFCLLLFFIVPPVIAEPIKKPKESLDFDLKLGPHQFFLPYYFAGDKIITEGYLLSVADLALIKVEFDSFADTMSLNLDLLSKQCKKTLNKCQDDANSRFVSIVKENESLTQRLNLQVELYKEQKTKTIFYSITAIAATGLTSFLIVKTIY